MQGVTLRLGETTLANLEMDSAEETMISRTKERGRVDFCVCDNPLYTSGRAEVISHSSTVGQELHRVPLLDSDRKTLLRALC